MTEKNIAVKLERIAKQLPEQGQELILAYGEGMAAAVKMNASSVKTADADDSLAEPDELAEKDAV